MTLSISRRLYLVVAILAFGCAILATALIWLGTQRQLEARARELQALVDSAIGVLENQRQLAESGVISEDEAKKRALSVLSSMRYGNDDYFIIWGLTPEVPMLLTGGRIDTIGKPQLDTKDLAGRPFVRDMVREIQASGQTLFHIVWTHPRSKEPTGKTNFAKLYRPWGLIVATGTFEQDLEADIRAAVYQAGSVTLALIVLLAGITTWIARGISRPLGQLRTAMLDLADNRAISEEIDTTRADEIGEMARAVAVFRENAAQRAKLEETARLEDASRVARQGRVDRLIAEFRSSITAVMAAVEASMSHLEATARTLSGIASEATSQAEAANGASGGAAESVKQVVDAAEQLGTSVEEIGRQVTQANNVVTEATSLAKRSDTGVTSLAEAAQKIGNVVELIRTIAEQTNLLALNATIEAARAGEAGRGFAVVAGEVKSLASQTAKATEEIGAQVSGIQTSTRDAVEAIRTITSTMDEIKHVTSVIAETVDDQTATTKQIVQNVARAADGTTTVADNVASVSTAIAGANRSAHDVLGSTGELRDAARRLQNSVDRFLTEVAAA